VPIITASPAYQQDGLLITTFDEGQTSDAGSCCGEIPGPGAALPGGGGPGGGDTGAILMSRYIVPGTVSNTAYNHYAMLGSVEDIFGLSRLGFAAGTTAFGSDVFTQPSGTPAPATQSTATTSTTTSTRSPVAASRCVVPALPKAKHGKLAPATLLRGVAIDHSKGKAFVQFTAVRREAVAVAFTQRHHRAHRLHSITASGCQTVRAALSSGHGTVTIRAGVHGGAATVTKRY